MKKGKRIVAFMLAFVLFFTCGGPLAAPLTADAATISSWMYWDADGRDWGGPALPNGCLIVALTKMLINTGIKTSAYKPTDMKADLIKKGVTFSSSNWAGGDWPGAVAKMSSKLSHFKKIDVSGMSDTQKKNILMNYAKGDFQVIIHLSNSSGLYHWVYLWNKQTVEKGVPWIMDSINAIKNKTDRKNANVVEFGKNIFITPYKYKDIQLIHVYSLNGKNPSFTVRYNANGGSGKMEDTQAIYGGSTKTRKNTFTRPGYIFTGWTSKRNGDGLWYYKKSDGSTKWFKLGKQTKGYSLVTWGNGTTVSKTTPYNNDVVTFYAQWKADPNYTPPTPTPKPTATPTPKPTATPTPKPTATPTPKPTATPTPKPALRPGDVTGEGQITSADALQIQRYVVKRDSVLQNASDAVKKAADVTGDGQITSADALQIQRYVVKRPSVLDKTQ